LPPPTFTEVNFFNIIEFKETISVV